jgi:DNA-binding HxlR family transcriptional regulator
MRDDRRSACPINLALEVLGDRWSLLILRDAIFAGKRTFGEFQASDERISNRVLSERLARLVEEGILTRQGSRSHKQKAEYRLTERGISLLPVLSQLGIWGRGCVGVTPVSEAVAVRLDEGGPTYWARLMDDLRADNSAVGGGRVAESSNPSAPGKRLSQRGRFST